MKAREYRNLSSQELGDKLKDLRRELMELNFQRKASRIEKPHFYRQIKKDISRVITIIGEQKNGKN